MSTSIPTTDRTDSPTLTDGTWLDETPTPDDVAPTGVQQQFESDCRRRLHNLVDDENTAMF